MGRIDREQMIEELHQLFNTMELAVLADYRGMTVEDLAEFRTKLREVQARFRIVKNTLSIRAVDDTPLEELKEHFVGPVAIMFTSEDPVGPAKVFVDFMKVNKNLGAKAGVLSGQVLAIDDINRLAAMPDRDTLLAQTLSTFAAPTSNFVRTLSEIPASLVRVLDAVRAEKEAA